MGFVELPEKRGGGGGERSEGAREEARKENGTNAEFDTTSTRSSAVGSHIAVQTYNSFDLGRLGPRDGSAKMREGRRKRKEKKEQKKKKEKRKEQQQQKELPSLPSHPDIHDVCWRRTPAL